MESITYCQSNEGAGLSYTRTIREYKDISDTLNMQLCIRSKSEADDTHPKHAKSICTTDIGAYT